jgi:hypothetical protein
MRQREIAVFELLEIAQHLRFAVMRIEHGMSEVLTCAGKFPEGMFRIGTGTGSRPGNDAQYFSDIGCCGRFVDRNADRAVSEVAQVDAGCFRALLHCGFVRHLHVNRVKEVFTRYGKPCCTKTRGHRCGAFVNARGDPADAVGAVIHGIHGSHYREQGLSRADIGCRFLPADMLLTRLKRHTKRLPSVSVFGHADNAARDIAFEFFTRGKERCMRSAVSHRNAEALGVSEAHIGAPLARRRDQRKRHKVGCRCHVNAGGMGCIGKCAVIFEVTEVIRILHEGSEVFGL